jgi:hypothetical protein
MGYYPESDLIGLTRKERKKDRKGRKKINKWNERRLKESRKENQCLSMQRNIFLNTRFTADLPAWQPVATYCVQCTLTFLNPSCKFLHIK